VYHTGEEGEGEDDQEGEVALYNDGVGFTGWKVVWI